MNDDATNPKTDLAKSQQDSVRVRADLHGPPMADTTGKKFNRRIDQPERLTAPHQLPAFQDLQRLMNAIQDEEVDFTNFCDALTDVPQVKKLILRDARSILAGRGNRIETVKHAVAMLGLRRIRLMLSQLAEPYEDKAQNQQDSGRDEKARVSA